MGGVLAFFISLASLAFAADSPAVSHEWLSLHYFVRSGTGPKGEPEWQTEIREDEKSAGFFLAREGRADPERELLAYRAALESPRPKDPDADVRCRFPARFAWAKRNLSLGASAGAPAACPRYDTWRKEIAADSAYLLFAAQFMNSPASMYGHTLLQLGRSGKTKDDTILDYVVAYGAETGGVGGPAYIVLGLTGGFPGFFSTVPFYLKIREYNDAESRDLWAYKLKLNSGQLDFLLAHLWELRTVNFPYYFLGKNCSYFLLRFLDLVNSGKSLTADLPPWTIPVDTIRALETRGWIEARTYRPSRSARMLARRAMLDNGARDLARALAEKDQDAERGQLRELAGSDPERAAKVLDTAYELARFRLAGAQPTASAFAREQWLLRERTKLTSSPAALAIAGEPPENAHLSNRLGLAAGILDREGPVRGKFFGTFEWRPALHDLLDPSYGLDPYGEQEILTTRVRFDSLSKHFTLDGFEAIRIRALAPIDPWMKKVAWRARLGTGRLADTACEGWRCLLFRLEGGAGVSVPLLSGTENIAFALAALDVHSSPALASDYRIGAGPELGLKLRPFGGRWRVLAEASGKRYFLGDKRWVRSFSVGQSVTIGKLWEVRGVAGGFQRNREFSVGVYRFY